MKRLLPLSVGLLLLLAACVPRVEVSLPVPTPPDVYTFGPTFYCGYRVGQELAHQVFVPAGSGPVRLTLLGGESAATDLEEGWAPADDPGAISVLLTHPGGLGGCITPPLAAEFDPTGTFVYVHTFGEDRQHVYSLDDLNSGGRGIRAYQALNVSGEPVGVLLFVEEWVDADYNDAVLLLQGAAPIQ